MVAVDHATNHRVSRTHMQAFHTRLLVQRSRAKFLIGHSCGTLLWHPLVGHSSRETSCKTLTSSTQNERFARDFLRNSDIKSPKRAFRPSLTPKVTRQVSKTSVSYEPALRMASFRAVDKGRTSLPPKVTRQVSKTSVSCETSSKTHMSKSAKRGFRTRLPPKVQRQHPSEHTHHATLPSSFAIPAPPNDARSNANPNVTATFTSTTTHNLPIPCTGHESFRVHTSNAHKVLRLPRNVTSVTHRNDSLRLPRKSHFHTSKPAQSPAPATKSNNSMSSRVSFNKICTTPHVWNDFDPF